MAKTKKNSLEALGFGNDGKVKTLDPLGPIEDKPAALGFGPTPSPANPEAIEGPTPSAKFGEGYLVGTSMKNYVAANQDGWDQFANFLEQTGVSTLTGIVESASYMGDLQQHWNWLHDQEKEYTNWAAEKMKEVKQANKELFPVYLSDENETFQPGNAEWWAHHGGDTVGTVLGLLIPAAGVAKLGKVAGLGNFGRSLSATVASRAAESTMEANQVFEESYNKLLAQGAPETTAKFMAGEAATKVWNTNWLFAIQDFGQFSSLLKGVKSAAKGSIGKSIASVLGNTLSEGVEEGGQYTVSQEALRLARDSNADFFGEGFGKRLADYIDDDEFKTSVALGMAGGAVFSAAGQAFGALTESDPGDTSYIQRAKDKVKKLVDWGLGKERANYVGDTITSKKYDNLFEANQIVDRINTGKLNDYITELEEFKKTPDITPEARATLDDIIKDTNQIIDMEAKLKASPIPAVIHKPLMLNALEQFQNIRLIDKSKSELEKLKQDAIKEIPIDLIPLKDAQIALEGYRELAKKQPEKFGIKAAQAQNVFNQLKEQAILAFPNLDEVLATTKDQDLFRTSYQLTSATEDQVNLKAEMAHLRTKQGIEEQLTNVQQRKEREAANTLVSSPGVTTTAIRDALKTVTDQKAQETLMNKLHELTAAAQQSNLNAVDAEINRGPTEQTPEIVGPEMDLPEVTGPDIQGPEITGPEYIEGPGGIDGPPELMPSDEFDPFEQGPPELEPDQFDPNIQPPEITRGPQEGDIELAKSEVDALLDRLSAETPAAKSMTREERDREIQAIREARERTTTPAWLKEHDDNGEYTLYYDNENPGTRLPAYKIFATDPETGLLLANTPKVKVGDSVILKVENNFRYTWSAGYKPTGPHNYVINVYLEGVDRPIKQLPSEDHPKYKNNASAVKVIKQLRDRVIDNGGELETTIVAKNIGSIRRDDQLRTLDVLEYDYIQENGEWKMTKTPHNPVLGYIDFNGRINADRVAAMRGMTPEVADDIINSDRHGFESAKDLADLKGMTVTFRTSPDGTKRIVALKPRKLNGAEIGWLETNMARLIDERKYTELANIINIPKHPAGIYSTKDGKRMDLLKLARNKFHIVETSAKTSEIAMPIRGKSGKGLWIIIRTGQLEALLTGKPYAFKVIDSNGLKGPVLYDHPKGPGIAAEFKKLLSNQFKNINKDNHNIEIRYTDPVSPENTYPSYYDYLKATESVHTDLKGSTTLGTGDDTSYSFDEAALYLDPNPTQTKITIEDRVPTKIEQPAPPEPTPAAKPTDASLEEIKKAAKKRRTRLKPVLEGGHQFKIMGKEELQWFKDHYGEEFLSIAKGVDSFIATNGVEAYGMYHDSLVTLAENAPEGTAYHEAGHFFLDPDNGLITEEEKESLLDEASKVYGIKRSTVKGFKPEPAYEDEVEKIGNSLNISYEDAANELGLEFDRGEPTRAIAAEQDYSDYFARKYAITNKYTGPRNKRELERDITAMVTKLNDAYVSERATKSVDYAPIGSPGEIVPITIRFLENIKKNSSHSTALDKPFKFKDATPKENEILGRFYNSVLDELKQFSATTGKSLPKVIPNDRLVEKLSEWLGTNYGLQTYKTDGQPMPYGLRNIVKGNPHVNGAEVFISDGLHFPKIASGHNKKLGDSNVSSNTLGWFIETEIDDDLFLYEFQSDIIPEVQEGEFDFNTSLSRASDGEMTFTLSLGQTMATFKGTREQILKDAHTKIVNQITSEIYARSMDVARNKVSAEKRRRGDTAFESTSAHDELAKAAMEKAANPVTVGMVATYLRAIKKSKFFIKTFIENRENSDLLNILAKKLGNKGFRPILELLQGALATENIDFEFERVLQYGNATFDYGATIEMLHRIASEKIPINKVTKKPIYELASNDMTGWLKLYNDEKNKHLKAAKSYMAKKLATKGKRQLLRKNDSAISDYYDMREIAITDFYVKKYKDAVQELIPSTITRLMDSLVNQIDTEDRQTVTSKMSPADKLQEDYKHWYSIMFEKFIKISLLRAKAAGRNEVYLPTYASMHHIEGSKTTGMIYATPFEDLTEEVMTRAMNKAFVVGKYEYYIYEGTYRKALEEDQGADPIIIDKVEYDEALKKYVKNKGVGPFYAALSKIKGLDIKGLHTPKWSKEPLLRVNLENYNPVSVERFKAVQQDLNAIPDEAYDLDYILEEKLMDDFEKYKLSNGKYKPKTPKAKGFFKRLLQMIKNLLGYKTPIEKLFKRIDTLQMTPEQKEKIINKFRTKEPGVIRFKKLPGFQTVLDQQESVEAFSSEVIRLANDAARDKGISMAKVITDDNLLDVLLQAVKEDFTARYKALAAIPVLERQEDDHIVYFNYLSMGLEENPDNVPAEFQEYIGSYENPRTAAGFTIEGFRAKVIKDLSRYGFRVDISEDQEELMDLKQEDEGERLHDIDHTLINPSESLSQRVKMFLASIPEPVVEEGNVMTGETKKTIFGTPKFLDFQQVDSMLALKLRDSINPITRLAELADNDPTARVIYDRLIEEKNKGNIQTYNEFAVKYNRDGYYKKTVLFETKIVPLKSGEIDEDRPHATTRLEYKAKTIDTDRGSSHRTLFNRWREAGIRKRVTDTDGTVNPKIAAKLQKDVQGFKQALKDSKKQLKKTTYETLVQQFNSVLKDLGVTIPSQVWEFFNKESDAGKKFMKIEHMFFGERDRSLETLTKAMVKGQDPYEGSNVIEDLAKLSSAYLDDPRGASFRNESNDPEYPINFPSTITEKINLAKANPLEFFRYYDRDAFYDKNPFLLAIKGSASRVNLSFTSVSRVNEQRVKEFGRRTEIDSLIMRFATFFNNAVDSSDGWFFLGTLADKSKQALISLPKRAGVQASRDFLKETLINLMHNEVTRMNRLKIEQPEGIKHTPLPSEIENMKNRGQKFLYVPMLENVTGLKASVSEGEISPDEYRAALKTAEATIDSFIDLRYKVFRDYLVKNDLVIDNGVTIENSRIPRGILAGRNTEDFLKEFFYNDTAWRVSMSQVLMGDLAQYKSSDDYFKRAYQLVTPGLKPHIEEQEFIYRGIYPKQFKTNVAATLNRLAKLASKETAQKYEKVNKTDAQSLITIHAYRKISQALGLWTNDHELIYQSAWVKDMTIRQAIKEGAIPQEKAKQIQGLAYNITLQPFKPFQYNDREIVLPDGSTMIFKEQFKDSITPITPELTVVHEGYKGLLDYMIDNEIDVMSAADTAKVGSYGVINDATVPAEEWQKRKISLRDLRFPQLMPEKKKKEISGTQLHKLILGNLKLDADYKVGNRTIKGSKLVQEYNDAWFDKIVESSKYLQDKLGVDDTFTISDEPAKRKEQLFKLKLVLQQELGSRELNENYQDILDIIKLSENEYEYTLPLSFPAFATKFQSILANLWKKNILRQKNAGYSAINLADFGVMSSNELKFMEEEDGEYYTEIGLPIDFAKNIGLEYGKHILPNGRILWGKDENGNSYLSENQKKALQFILYRIPTSNKSSMLPVRVAFISPPQLNNVVIIPGELTIQQGLDFDVDKSQLLRRVLNDEGMVDKDHTDTRLFDIYWGILSNENHTSEMLTPLATPMLEAKLDELRKKGVVDIGEDVIVYTVESDVDAEIRNKDGKAEIGIASRFNTGHSVIQIIKPYVGNRYARINIDSRVKGYEYNELGREKDSSGKLISENYGETQQAALDAAKNPLLAYLGVIRGTMAAFETMIGFGVPLDTAVDFFMQPIIKEWTKFYKQEGQNIDKATQKLMKVHPAVSLTYEAAQAGELEYAIDPIDLKARLELRPGQNPTSDGVVLSEFIDIMRIAAHMGKLNNVLSIDTFQNATSMEALDDMKTSLNQVTDPENSIFIDKSVFSTTNGKVEGKRLAAFYHYGIDNALSFMKKLFPAGSDTYRRVVDYYAKTVNKTDNLDEDTVKDLHKFTDFYLLDHDSLLSRTLLAVHPSKAPFKTRWDYFNQEFSIWNYINKVVEAHPATEESAGLEDNELIKNIESLKTFTDKVVMIGIRNTDSNINKSEITNGWERMLNSEHQDIRILAHDLVRYSIYTSGFSMHTRSMFDLVPVSYWSESGVGAAWKNIANNIDSNNIDIEAVVLNYVRHRYGDIERFPELYGEWRKGGFQSKFIRDVVTKDEDHIVQFSVDKNASNGRALPRFFRLEDRAINDYRLYEASPDGRPIYKEIQPLGQKQAFVEVSATGRAASKHPYNTSLTTVTDPWKNTPRVTLNSPLYSSTTGGTHAYVAKYLPTEVNTPEVVMIKMIEDESEVETKAVMEALLRNAHKITTQIGVAPLPVDKDFIVPGRININDNNTSDITINTAFEPTSEGQARKVITHELIHAYTVGVLEDPQTPKEIEFARNTKRLLEDAKKRLGTKAKDVYGLTDEYEFVAEIGSSPRFRAILRNSEGLWTRWIRNIRKVLGLKDSYGKYLTDLNQLIDDSSNLQRSKDEKSLNYKVYGPRPLPKKKLNPFEEMMSSLKAREDKFRKQGKKDKADSTKATLAELEQQIGTNRNKAILTYLTEVTKEVQDMQAVYNQLSKDPGKINPDILVSMREQIQSYKVLVSFSKQIHRDPTAFVDPGQDPKELLTNLDKLINDIRILSDGTRRLATHRFAHVILATLNDPKLTIDYVLDQLDVADRDVDIINRWTQTGMETNDIAVQTAAKMIKDNAAKAYLKIQDDLYVTTPQEVVAEVAVKMKSKKGKFYWDTKEIKYTKVGFLKALNEYEAWLKSKGKNPNSIADKFLPVLDANSLTQNDDGVHFINPFSEEGRAILKIKEGHPDYALKQFYSTFVLGYLKGQEEIPAFSDRPGLRIPSIQRSMLEGFLKESGTGKFQILKEAAIDAVKKRYDETDLKPVDETNQPQQGIPIRFTAKQDGKEGRLSTREVSLDIATTLPLFIHEMYSRKGLNKLVSDLELGKLVLAERKVMKTKRIKGPGLTPFLSSEREGIELGSGAYETIDGDRSNAYEAFAGLLRRYVYGEYKKSEGEIETSNGILSLTKIVDSLLRFTGFKIMFGNLAIPLTNAIVGEATMIKEITGGNLINASNYWAGFKLYKEAAMASIADLGRREKKTKYGRIYSYFNLGDNERAVGDLGISTNYTRTVFDKVSRSGANLVDFYLNSKALGATLHRFKAKDKEGKEVSLYDAIDVTKDGRIELQEGYTYRDKKSISPADIIEIREYGLRVSQLMNGIYNKMDKPAMNELIVGRLVGFMRNWLKAGIDARWRTKFDDRRVQQENEGHYVSALVAFNNAYTKNGWIQGSIDSLRIMLWMDARDPNLLLLPNELNLEEEERQDIIKLRQANIRKTLFELYVIAAASILMAFAWDDDDKDSYTKYMLARIRRELTTFLSPTTAWDVLRSPTVALNTVESFNKILGDTVNAGSAIIEGEEQPIYERGPGKGQNKLIYDTKKLFGLGFATQFEDLDTKTRLIVKGYR